MTESIEEYIQKLRENTAVNRVKKQEQKEKDEEERIVKLTESMNALEGYIVSTCKVKMMNASNYGHFFTQIMEFSNFDMFDENFKFVYLIKGPSRNRNRNQLYGVSYFKENDIVPMLDRLNEYMKPIRFSVRFDKINQTHTLYANWYELNS
jgi:hypothetical protein